MASEPTAYMGRPIVMDVDVADLLIQRLHVFDGDGGALSEREEDIVYPSDLALQEATPTSVPTHLYPTSRTAFEVALPQDPSFPLELLSPESSSLPSVSNVCPRFPSSTPISFSPPLPNSGDFTPGHGPNASALSNSAQAGAKRKCPTPNPTESTAPHGVPSTKAKKKRRPPSAAKKAHCKANKKAKRKANDLSRSAYLTGNYSDCSDAEEEEPTALASSSASYFPAHRPLRLPKKPSKACADRYRDKLIPIRVQFDFGEDTPVATSGWCGTNVSYVQKLYTLEEAKAMGCKLPEGGWDGVSPRSIVDRNGVEFATLVGQPQPQSNEKKPWGDSMQDAYNAMASTAQNCTFDDDNTHHRRGNFRVLTRSITHGGGRSEPGNRKNKARNERELEKLCQEKPIKRLAHFQSSVLQTYHPAIFDMYRETLLLLLQWSAYLIVNFTGSVFAAITFNFGPLTECFLHTDPQNAAWGMCAITALGPFDWTLGGHLILWDLKLIIPFPPGSTILIPSALLTHSNTPIQEGETRFSVTQYSASGLFRWVYNGMQSDADFLHTASKGDRKRFEEVKKDRWQKSLKMFRRRKA